MATRKLYFTSIIIGLFFNNHIICQNLNLDDSPFNIEFIRTKNNSNFAHRTEHRTSSEAKFINVRIRLTSKNGKKAEFDPNPISFILDDSKKRIRPTNFDYPIAHLNSSMNRVLMEYDKDIVSLAGYVYDPKIIDTFENYTYKDYENVTHSYKWGRSKNAKKIKYYYEIRGFKKRKANLIFLVPRGIKKASLYYGCQKVKDITFR
ncbi:hypothetical protein DFQ03_2869 [Maribacter caenipelagi]|uniref:Uncharacterized protein n=1 Tax=Maribacter caenipelagi TaxID=1447781 RepID=A0A4R7D1Y8_9FLAO|nr:hypothetical protein [Maribacter caenipelagi]TDS13575.1 hypothetical protein DFQ03_2869 [Maribacter caenipelagi]